MVLVNDLTKETVRPRVAVEDAVNCCSLRSRRTWPRNYGSSLVMTKTLAYEPWPVAEAKYLAKSEVEIPMQINGKLRGVLTVPIDSPQPAVEEAAKALPAFTEWTANKTIRKVIHVPNKLINFVVG